VTPLELRTHRSDTQDKLRQVSHKVLKKALRSHKVSHGRVNKGVEVLCVTSYDAALEGLQAHKELHPDRDGEPIHFLETLGRIWKESPSVS
jgi:hypothetical protein